MNIKIINIKNTKRYNKEPFKKDDELYIFCGRPKKLSNPYEIGKDGNRGEVIEKFRELAEDDLFNEPPSTLNKEIKNLADYAKKHKISNLVLGCYCKPLACHCDVIKEILDDQLNARLF